MCEKKPGIGDWYKEIKNENNEYEKIRCSGFMKTMLTGTKTKVRAYGFNIFKNLFEAFEQNLKEAEALLIIDYGAKDEKINNTLVKCFDYENKPSLMIDLYPGEKVNNLANMLHAKLISKELDEIKKEDIDF
ncbi:MAG: hypothetical protein K6T34_05190 [Thermoflavifilum sp.]|nr:hypothetical protein [Thermoflavifilum sp.]